MRRKIPLLLKLTLFLSFAFLSLGADLYGSSQTRWPSGKSAGFTSQCDFIVRIQSNGSASILNWDREGDRWNEGLLVLKAPQKQPKLEGIFQVEVQEAIRLAKAEESSLAKLAFSRWGVIWAQREIPANIIDPAFLDVMPTPDSEVVSYRVEVDWPSLRGKHFLFIASSADRLILSEDSSLRNILSNWMNAWTNKKLEDYLAHYDPNGRINNMQLNEFGEWKRRMFGRYENMLIRFTNIRSVSFGDIGVTCFGQDFFGDDKFAERGDKVVVWHRNAQKQWQIASEFFTPQP